MVQMLQMEAGGHCPCVKHPPVFPVNQDKVFRQNLPCCEQVPKGRSLHQMQFALCERFPFFAASGSPSGEIQFELLAVKSAGYIGNVSSGARPL